VWAELFWGPPRTIPDAPIQQGWELVGDRGWVFPHAGPAVAPNADGNLEVAAIGSDLAPWHVRTSDLPFVRWGQWHSFGPPGGEEVISKPHGGRTPHPTPALAADADGSLEIFVVRHDLTVWHRRQDGPNSDHWSDWASLGRPGDGTLGRISVAARPGGQLELFANDLHGAVWHCWQTHPNDRNWSRWHPLGTPGGHPARSRPVPMNNEGGPELFVVANDGTVRHCWQRAGSKPGDPWSTWVSLGSPGGGLAELAVAVNANEHLVLFATEPDNGSDLWQRQQTPRGSWSAWQSRASLLQANRSTIGPLADPTLVMWPDRRLQLFLRVTYAQDPESGGLYRPILEVPATGDWVLADFPH
jgi:hypothetical protein